MKVKERKKKRKKVRKKENNEIRKERIKEIKRERKKQRKKERRKQGWIHGNPVADSWAGAVLQKPLGIQKCGRRTDGRMD